MTVQHSGTHGDSMAARPIPGTTENENQIPSLLDLIPSLLAPEHARPDRYLSSGSVAHPLQCQVPECQHTPSPISDEQIATVVQLAEERTARRADEWPSAEPVDDMWVEQTTLALERLSTVRAMRREALGETRPSSPDSCWGCGGTGWQGSGVTDEFGNRDAWVCLECLGGPRSRADDNDLTVGGSE